MPRKPKATADAVEPEDRFAVGHHLGLTGTIGYDVLPDGSIKLPPILCRAMVKASEREAGLKKLMEATNIFLADELTRVHADQRDFWRDVSDEVGIDLGQRWSFNYITGAIFLTA